MNARRQHGESLIGMMVGLVITLLTIGAMLMTYSTMVSVSVPATRSAIREGQAASALLAAQIELQQAGFGIDPLLDPAPNLRIDQGGRRLIWRYRNTVGAPQSFCAGLRIATGTGAATDGIYFLPPVACNSADAAVAFTSQLLASEAVLFEPADEARSYNLSGAVFTVTRDSTCGPFGITSPTPNRALVSLQDQSGATPVTIFSYCLTNTNTTL